MDLQTIMILIGALLIFAQVIVNLTPTKKDDDILKIIRNIFDFIVPNVKTDEAGKTTLHKGNLFKMLWKLLRGKK